MSDIFTSLALAVSRAVDRDLPDIEFERKRYASISLTENNTNHLSEVSERVKRRPGHWEVQVYHFPQTWGDTSTGFGGVAGQAFTEAYTTVVIESMTNAAVYFGGRLAYVIKQIDNRFYLDLNAHDMAAVRDASRYRIPEGKSV